MNTEMHLIWSELLEDLPKAVMLWQFAVIGASLAIAWILSGMTRSYGMSHAPESWKVGIGGFNRVMFPLASLVFVYIGSYVLSQWQHVSLLVLTVNLLWATVAIRLCIYGMGLLELFGIGRKWNGKSPACAGLLVGGKMSGGEEINFGDYKEGQEIRQTT